MRNRIGQFLRPLLVFSLVGYPSAAASSGAARDGRQATAVSGEQKAPGVPGSTQRSRPPEWEWWNSAADRAAIGLSDEQAKKIERIYRSTAQALEPYSLEFRKQRSELERVSHERIASDGEYAVLLSGVGALQNKLWQERTLMLYRISRILTAEQHLKLQKLRDARNKAGKDLGAKPQIKN